LAETVYEGMFILDPNRYGRAPEKVVDAIPRMVEEAGGEMLVSRLWDERRLAFPIKGHAKGTYWLTYFRMEPGRLAEIRRKCEINEDFLRVLFLKVDPRIVDVVVSHARSGSVAKAADLVGEGKAAPGAESPPEGKPEPEGKTEAGGSADDAADVSDAPQPNDADSTDDQES